MPANDYQITRALDGDVISGKIPAALASLPAGTLVRTKNPGTGIADLNQDNVELELSSGTGPVFVLERDVLADGSSVPLEYLALGAPPSDYAGQFKGGTPYLVGGHGSARAVQEGVWEGVAFVQASGGQTINGSTAIGAELTTLAGKWALRTDPATQELLGYFRGKTALQDAGNTVRIIVQVVQGGIRPAIS